MNESSKGNYNKQSTFIIFPSMQYSLTHAICVLLSFVLALPHVYVSYHFAPACLDIQLA